MPRWAEAPTLDEALAAGPQEDTRAEFGCLSALKAAVDGADDPGLVAVTAVGYLPDINGIVMETLSGVPLRHRLWRPTMRRGCVVSLFERSGRLPRLYHDAVGEAVAAPFDAAVVLAEVDSLDRALRSSGAVPAGMRPVLETVRTLFDGLGGSQMEIAATHGDFTPANVLVTFDDRVALIDPNRYQAATIEDLARMIVSVRSRRERAASGGMFPPAEPLAAWERSLVAGYGGVDEAVLGAFKALTVLRRWVEMGEQLRRVGSRSARAVGRAIARRFLHREARISLGL